MGSKEFKSSQDCLAWRGVFSRGKSWGVFFGIQKEPFSKASHFFFLKDVGYNGINTVLEGSWIPKVCYGLLDAATGKLRVFVSLSKPFVALLAIFGVLFESKKMSDLNGLLIVFIGFPWL